MRCGRRPTLPVASLALTSLVCCPLRTMRQHFTIYGPRSTQQVRSDEGVGGPAVAGNELSLSSEGPGLRYQREISIDHAFDSVRVLDVTDLIKREVAWFRASALHVDAKSDNRLGGTVGRALTRELILCEGTGTARRCV